MSYINEYGCQECWSDLLKNALSMGLGGFLKKGGERERERACVCAHTHSFVHAYGASKNTHPQGLS